MTISFAEFSSESKQKIKLIFQTWELPWKEEEEEEGEEEEKKEKIIWKREGKRKNLNKIKTEQNII